MNKKLRKKLYTKGCSTSLIKLSEHYRNEYCGIDDLLELISKYDSCEEDIFALKECIFDIVYEDLKANKLL